MTPSSRWWVQTPECRDGKTRIATDDGEQPSMIVWLATYNASVSQVEVARMVCDAVNAWQERKVQQYAGVFLRGDGSVMDTSYPKGDPRRITTPSQPELPCVPWVIEPPVQLEIRCDVKVGGCGSLVGYTALMVHEHEGQGSCEHYRYIACPSCEKAIVLKETP